MKGGTLAFLLVVLFCLVVLVMGMNSGHMNNPVQVSEIGDWFGGILRVLTAK